jgi:hypothetical protein
MFRNSDNDSDTEDGHMLSGIFFRGVHLENLFKKSCREEGFYSGEELDLTDKEHLEPTRTEEGKAEELRQSETETSGNDQIIEVSNINPPVFSIAPRSQNSQNHQSLQSVVTSNSAYTQTGSLGNSMEDEMRLPIFRRDVSEDVDQHWFLCEAVWNIKSITNEAMKRTQFITMLRDCTLSWYMKLVQGLVQPKPLNEIKNALIIEFKKPKSDLECITELKDIKQKVAEPVWEFDQRFKTLTYRLTFQIPDEHNKEWFIVVFLQHIRVPLIRKNISSHEEALEIAMNLESTPMGEYSSDMSQILS